MNMVGVDFKHKFVDYSGEKMKLSIWDTAGQERFRTLTSSYYRGAQGVIMVFDVTKRGSFDNLSKVWLKELQVYTDLDRLVLMIVGNKIDKASKREVSKEEAEELATDLSGLYIESSAKTKEGVKAVFEELLQEIMRRPEVEEEIVLQRHVLAVGSPTREDIAGSCLC